MAEVKERPIIFSSEMIRAILDGRKTQTRRTPGLEDVNKCPDLWIFNKSVILDYKTKKSARGKFGAYFISELIEPKTISICPEVSPYGQPSDRLWVRETWDVFALPNEVPSICYRADSTAIPILGKTGYQYQRPDNSHKWRASIFMPRWVSRITLEIVDVRIERIQDISGEDAVAEGIFEPIGCRSESGFQYEMRSQFMNYWDLINGKKYPWESNPWVWCIEFKRIN